MVEFITIHCGTAKTGSTSIQEAFSHGRSALATIDILYPSVGERNDHTTLLLSEVDAAEIPNSFGRQSAEGRILSQHEGEAGWVELDRQVTETKARHLVLSSEYIAGLRPETIERFTSRLKRYSQDLRGILYVREPVGLYMSRCQQVLKYGADLPVPSQSFQYRKKIEKLDRAFGGKLTLREFSREELIDSDVISDLLSVLTKDFKEVRAQLPTLSSNIGLSAEAMAVMQEYNRIVWGNARISGNLENRNLLKVIEKIQEKVGCGRPRLKNWAQTAVVKANSNDLDWLSKNRKIDLRPEQRNVTKRLHDVEPSIETAALSVESVFEITQSKVQELRSLVIKDLVKGEDDQAMAWKKKEANSVLRNLQNAYENLVKKARYRAERPLIQVKKNDERVIRRGEAELKPEEKRARSKRFKRTAIYLLALPYVVLTLPVSLPAIVYFIHRRKKQKTVMRLHTALELPKKDSIFMSGHHNDPTADVLIWCPISVSGLTTQLSQLTAILKKIGCSYKISYHIDPSVDHPECAHWIDSSRINRPKVVFFMERYVPFERGFEEAIHVFYVNLDWLKPEAVSVARVYADLIICPVKHRFDELVSTFDNSKVIQLPWPTAATIDMSRARADLEDLQIKPIRVLYVGNDYNERSRKSPFATIKAILACRRTDLVFDLKFRSALPENVKKALAKRPNVDRVIDHPISAGEVEALYEVADVNLIPNECEGNGLSIIEAFAKGVVPAVLDGYPMKDVVTESTGYFIECEEIGSKEWATAYETTSSAISRFLSRLDPDEVRRRKGNIVALENELRQRQTELEAVVQGVLASAGLGDMDKHTDEGIGPVPHAFSDEALSPVDLKSLLSKPSFRIFRDPELIDVHLTTSRRADVLAPTIERLLQAISASPFQHRISVNIDDIDPATAKVIERFKDQFQQLTWTGVQMGLPYHWNSIIDQSQAMTARSEKRPDFICYLQDDCAIERPETYFTEMVEAAELLNPASLGMVSGYHSSVHKGFGRLSVAGKDYILSDSVDGKNFLVRPKVLYSIGKLPWWFPDGVRRGNPGPVHGSHFDLWQWKESPNCLMRQGRVNIIIPGLCEHSAAASELSTWSNNTTDEAISKRLSSGKIYVTR